MRGDPDSWNPDHDLGLDRPHLARVCDHLLDGLHGFALDREAAADLLAAVPEAVEVARATRYFTAWAIRQALGRGVGQFLDLGCGLPLTCCHRILYASDPRAVAVLIDRDMVVATCLERRLVDVPHRLVVHRDLCEVDQVLTEILATGVIDPLRPVGILATGVLHLVPEGVAEVVAVYREAAAPGSVLAITHPGILHDSDRIRALGELHERAGAVWCPRGPETVSGLFGDWEHIGPIKSGGLASLTTWAHRTEDGVESGRSMPFLESYAAGLSVKPPIHRADAHLRVPRVRLRPHRRRPDHGRRRGCDHRLGGERDVRWGP